MHTDVSLNLGVTYQRGAAVNFNKRKVHNAILLGSKKKNSKYSTIFVFSTKEPCEAKQKINTSYLIYKRYNSYYKSIRITNVEIANTLSLGYQKF